MNPHVPRVPLLSGTRIVVASAPDDALLDAAGRSELSSRDAVAARARTMLADPKARVGIVDFYNQWTGATRLPVTTKSTTGFPAFTDAVAAGMALETPAFVQYVLWTGDHKLQTLLARYPTCTLRSLYDSLAAAPDPSAGRAIA